MGKPMVKSIRAYQKKNTILKGRHENIKLVVGRDVGLEQILDLVDKTPLWFFASCRVSLCRFSEWIRHS